MSSWLFKSEVKYITAPGWGVSDQGNYNITKKAGIRAYVATDGNSLEEVKVTGSEETGGRPKWSKAHLGFTPARLGRRCGGWASARASPDHSLPLRSEAPSCNLTSLIQSP